MSIWVAVAGAAIKGVTGAMTHNSAMMSNARQYGMEAADLEHRIDQSLASGQEEARLTQEAAQSAQMQVDLNEQQTQAQMAVANAAAGAEGGSIDMTVNETSRTADQSRHNLDLTLEDDMANVTTRTQDAVISDISRQTDAPDGYMAGAGTSALASGLFKYYEMTL